MIDLPRWIRSGLGMVDYISSETYYGLKPMLPYEYAGGINPAAIVSLLAGVLPCVPGFLNAAFPNAFPGVAPFWRSVYSYAWFAGFFVAGGLYLLLMGGRAKK